MKSCGTTVKPDKNSKTVNKKRDIVDIKNKKRVKSELLLHIFA
jgi:hypothetical protein